MVKSKSGLWLHAYGNPINPISTNYEKKEAENSFHIGRFSINFLAHKYAAKELFNTYLLTHLFQNKIDLHYLNIVMAALWTFCQHDNHNCQMNVNSMVWKVIHFLQ